MKNESAVTTTTTSATAAAKPRTVIKDFATTMMTQVNNDRVGVVAQQILPASGTLSKPELASFFDGLFGGTILSIMARCR